MINKDKNLFDKYRGLLDPYKKDPSPSDIKSLGKEKVIKRLLDLGIENDVEIIADSIIKEAKRREGFGKFQIILLIFILPLLLSYISLKFLTKINELLFSTIGWLSFCFATFYLYLFISGLFNPFTTFLSEIKKNNDIKIKQSNLLILNTSLLSILSSIMVSLFSHVIVSFLALKYDLITLNEFLNPLGQILESKPINLINLFTLLSFLFNTYLGIKEVID